MTKGELRNGFRALWMGVAVALPLFAPAQNIAHFLGEQDVGAGRGFGGKPAVDVIPGRRIGLGYALRYANLIPGSARVEVGARQLREGAEFTLDHVAGMLYVLVPVREHESIRVTYRHDPSAEATGLGSALPLMTLNFGQAGGLTMLFGVGGAQRFADGTVMQAHNAGLQNSLSFRGGKLSGLLLVSALERVLVRPDGASPDQTPATSGVEGTDRLIMQNLEARLGRGVQVTAEYKDVGQNFGGMNMLQSAGVAADAAQQLEKEKGIRRLGVGLTSASSAGFSFANSYRSIADGKGKIEFHDYGLKSNFLDLYYKSQRLDASFSRFRDIAEAERDQLNKERGIDRTSLGGLLKFGPGSLKFDRSSIAEAGVGIFRQSVGLDLPWLRAAVSEQRVDEAFTRAGDLAEEERGQLGKERGLSRRALSLAVPKGKDGMLASFTRASVNSAGGGFDSTALLFDGSKWGVEYWTRSVDRSFTRLGDLTPKERDAMILQTLRMYDPKQEVQDGDREWIVRESGLDRRFFRLKGEPLAGSAFKFETLGINSQAGGLSRLATELAFGKFSLGYRRLRIDRSFDRAFDLLETERKLYGNQVGFDRTDLSLGWKPSDRHKVSLSGLQVDSGKGGAWRTQGHLKGPGYEIQGAMRRVDSGFARALDINDPEKDLFAQLVGYKQYDLRLKFDALRNLKVDAFFYDSDNGIDSLRRFKRQAEVVYKPDGKTQLTFKLNDHQHGGAGLGLLFANDLMAFEGVRDFGRFGKLTAQREVEHYAGSQSERPSRVTNLLRYETKLGKNTSFATDQSRTNFADGGSESLQAYKLGWQLSRRFGLNLTEMFLDRYADKPDERTREFGVSYDFGNNLKAGYSLRRELNSAGGGRRNYSFELSEGEAGGMRVGGSYNEKRVDGESATALGKFSLTNPKPFRWGFLDDVKLSLGQDSHAEGGIWRRENKLASFSAKVRGSEIAATYGQLLMPGEGRAADRTYRFNYDPTGKQPVQLNLSYKVRTLPGGRSEVIRDYDAAYKIGDNFKLSHSTDTMPERAEGGAPLGSVTQPTKAHTWAIDWTPNASSSYKFAFQDLMNLDQKTLARRTNLTVSLFNDTGSPLRLSYGVEQNHLQTGERRTRHVCELAYDQKPGPNQTLSLSMGSVNWQHGIVENELWNRWTFALDYQIRF